MKKSMFLTGLLLLASLASHAQQFAVPVAESQEKMMEGKFAPQQCQVRHLGALGTAVRGGLG